jgi:hypothetical protein
VTPNATALATKVATLVECLCRMLAEQGAGPTCFCGVVPGEQVAWDYCGECTSGACGMGYVRLGRVFPTTAFPNEQGYGKCNTYLAAQITVGALRCAPVASDTGELPNEQDMAEAWLAVVADMGAMHQAVRCCGFRDYYLEGYTPLGPTGGCVGGEWMVTVLLDG